MRASGSVVQRQDSGLQNQVSRFESWHSRQTGEVKVKSLVFSIPALVFLQFVILVEVIVRVWIVVLMVSLECYENVVRCY